MTAATTVSDDPISIGRARLRPWDHAIGFALAVLYVLVLVRTAHNLGYARDEGFYFDAARSYAHWFELLGRDAHLALQRSSIDAAWSVNHEHPSIMKSLFGLSWYWLYEKHRVFAEPGTAFRFPGMVTAGACLWLVYVMGVRAYSRRAGGIAAAALGLMPQVFYHAHLDCFDVPVMFFWTLVVYCYWRSLEGRLRWAIATGIAWGLALDVKFNAFMLPAIFLLHWLVVRGRDVASDARRGGFPVPTAFIACLLLGVPVFIALWPWMWFDTLIAGDLATARAGRLPEYLAFHWNHPYYNMEFQGFNYFRPPFPRSYPYVLIAATVPAITLALAAAGLGTRLRAFARDAAPLAWLIPPVGARGRRWNAWHRAMAGDDARGTDLLFLGAGYAALALWWKMDTPIFGGTKHWFTAYPFLALFAGAGFEAAARMLDVQLRGRVRPSWLPGTALGAVCMVGPLAYTAHAHPFGLGAYTPLVGGAPGGADLGLNRAFWGYTTGSIVGVLNANVPPGGSVYLQDTAPPSFDMLKEDGRLRRNINAGWGVDSDFDMVHHELHMNEVDYQIWQAYQSPAVFYVLAHDGVPYLSLYRNPRRGR